MHIFSVVKHLPTNHDTCGIKLSSYLLYTHAICSLYPVLWIPRAKEVTQTVLKETVSNHQF